MPRAVIRPAARSESAEAARGGWAPTGSGVAGVFYVLLRAVHLLAVAVAFPLAYHLVRTSGPGHAIPGLLAGVLWIGAAAWALFYFGIHSWDYPTHLAGAVSATLLPLLNFVAAGRQNFAGGALAMMLASTVAIWLLLVRVEAGLIVPGWRRGKLAEAPGYMPGLVLGVLLALAPLLFLLGQSYAIVLSQASRANPGGRVVLLALPALLVQLVGETRLFFRSSVLGGENHMAGERGRLATRWTPLVAFCMFGSLVAFLVVIFWSAE